jgi:hypothetical protein
MNNDDVYLERSLNVVEHQGITLLDCIGWKDTSGGITARVFFKAGTDVAEFDQHPSPPLAAVSKVYSINSGLMFVVQVNEVDHLEIGLKDGSLTTPIQAPETDLFKGLSVLLVERNGEPFEVIETWLTFHRAKFNVDAVLMIDRGKCIENSNLKRKLKSLCSDLGLVKFVHVFSSVPLGGDTPPANHPFHAPDAPGKDRMGQLAGDPWASPLVELSLYEWAKWRFLGQARAVANLDLSDLLHPEGNPFEEVQNNSSGVIQLIGQRIYPWRVRAKDHVGFGDHICRQFDNPRANRRWCVAPARHDAEKIWRFVRIVGATPSEEETHGFWRAMGVKHPESNVAEIVPKTSLIEDETLLELATKTFRHNPVRPPESKMVKAPSKAVQAGRTCIVTCMKNEGPFILEWVAYHRAIGVDDFLVYTNDCTDGTDEMLNLLQDKGILQRRDNNFANSSLKPQHWALAAADKEPVLKDAGWVISMDVDEFINVHTGDGTLEALYETVGDANMIALTWRLFGNGDIHEFKDDLLINQFHRCAPELCRKPHQAWGFKTLFRNIGIYKKMGVHRPKGLKPDLWDQIKWVNGSGKPMPQKLIRNGWRSTTDSYGYDLVTLNHYAVRSAESFLVKRDRGRVNHVDRDQGLSYWFRMNNNWEEDKSILTKLPMVQAEFDRLMSDPELRAAHDYSVAQHRAKIDELRATENYSKFYQELTGDRMERLSRMHNHFGANVFLTGPQSVPQEVVDKDDLADDFFFTVERAKTTH